MIIAIFISIAVGDLLWLRWALRRLAALPRRYRTAARSLVGLFIVPQLIYLALFLTGSALTRQKQAAIPIWFLATTYIWSLAGLPISLLVNGIDRLGRRIAGPPKTGPTRREALATLTVAAAPLLVCAGVARSISQLHHFRVRRLTVPVAGLPRALDGIRIAHLSDVHVGKFTRAPALPAIADAMNRLKADLVLFTGDLIDFALTDLPAGIDLLRAIDPRGGMAVIEGNHDLFESADIFDATVKAAGLPLLVDEAKTVIVRGVPVQLLGTRWGSPLGNRRAAKPADFRRSIFDVLAPLRDPAAFPILLAHHPHAFDAAAEAGYPITLSGHTHGGQLNLSPRLGFGPLFYRYWSGPYRKPGSRLVVSNGVGNWFPLRVQAPAEIIDLTLVTA